MICMRLMTVEKMLHDQWGEYDGAPCYFRSWGGALDSGWHVIDGKTYYSITISV